MSGIFGVVSKQDCSELLFYGTDYHSHLGTEYGGMAVFGKELSRKIHSISRNQFKSRFEEVYRQMRGNKGIGAISDKQEQPIYLNSKFGPFAICTSGLIRNVDALTSELHKAGGSFSEMCDGSVNPTELVAKLINTGDTIVNGIERMFSKIDGSCSLLLLNKDGIYVARDRLGYTPLIIGQSKDGWAVTSETSAFSNLGFKVIKYLQPGEIIFLDESGMREEKKGYDKNQVCSFLWIYTGFPAASYEGINVEAVRERCGRFLAKNDDVNVDLVCGVPDSGIAHAIGYAMESGKPYRRPLIKYTPGYGRSYTPPSQDIRDRIAKMKLIAIEEIIRGNKIVICEDSIVRGTQLKNYTVQKLWENGAKEIHVRPACPPLMYPCRFNLSTRSTKELIARRAIKAIEGKNIDDISEYLNPNSKKYHKMVEWIAKDLGITSLKYQTIDNMVKAIGLPMDKLCTYCWTGKTEDPSSQMGLGWKNES